MNALLYAAILLGLSFQGGHSLQTTAPKAQSAQVSKIPLREAHFTPEQLKQYYLVYKNPNVIYLRTVFDAYLRGSSGYGRQFEPLKQWNKAYYRSKFIVLSINGDTFGGTLITIIFQDRPDKVFLAWVYPEGAKKTLTLRAFSPSPSFNKEDIRRIGIRYRQLLRDKKHAM